ncbi:MAG: helix-turn-helix transcriptional regulator [Acholeplasmatales bacterium]|nr:helix-turn-helix transcriptional regulator [Acholeplasmatales bacterium]
MIDEKLLERITLSLKGVSFYDIDISKSYLIVPEREEIEKLINKQNRIFSNSCRYSPSVEKLKYQALFESKRKVSNKLSEFVNDKLIELDISQSDLARASCLNRQTISKIICKDTKPKRQTLYPIIFGLKLSYEEAVKFLEYAGYLFNDTEPTDRILVCILKYADEMGFHFPLSDVDEILEHVGLAQLGSSEYKVKK